MFDLNLSCAKDFGNRSSGSCVGPHIMVTWIKKSYGASLSALRYDIFLVRLHEAYERF